MRTKETPSTTTSTQHHPKHPTPTPSPSPSCPRRASAYCRAPRGAPRSRLGAPLSCRAPFSPPLRYRRHPRRASAGGSSLAETLHSRAPLAMRRRCSFSLPMPAAEGARHCARQYTAYARVKARGSPLPPLGCPLVVPLPPVPPCGRQYPRAGALRPTVSPALWRSAVSTKSLSSIVFNFIE